ncbi:LysR family transcriptional regulator [Buttiauxella sp. B2]|uniref:LysR substrate-binding domain-containing protein n=1 Tax=Buttiauxella sp. B2 TaxID=2587812 RepID=UPI00111FF79E|nr:LysR substrate-binding domain-containing protein [Buttiauxella sp. B2]TNV21160.1 LysR family transcriptional regulator [Buttiauxella sp. B2]
MSEQLKGISVFVTAVEAGNFSLAASRLHLSRSAVGKTISQLEQRLGVRLFQRTTRSLALTDDGALFYEHCLRALEEIQTAEALLDSGKQTVRGRLRVSMPMLYGRMCIAPLLTEFASQHPELKMELLFSDRVSDLIEDGLDLVIRNGKLPDSSGLIARRIGSHRMMICASPDYLARRGEPQTIDSLSQHEVINYINAGVTHRWVIPQDNGKTIEFVPKSRLLMDELQSISAAAISGFGIALLPCWLIGEELQNGKLVRILRGYRENVYETHALWLQTPHLPLKVRLAVDMLVSRLPTSII